MVTYKKSPVWRALMARSQEWLPNRLAPEKTSTEITRLFSLCTQETRTRSFAITTLPLRGILSFENVEIKLQFQKVDKLRLKGLVERFSDSDKSKYYDLIH